LKYESQPLHIQKVISSITEKGFQTLEFISAGLCCPSEKEASLVIHGCANTENAKTEVAEEFHLTLRKSDM